MEVRQASGDDATAELSVAHNGSCNGAFLAQGSHGAASVRRRVVAATTETKSLLAVGMPAASRVAEVYFTFAPEQLWKGVACSSARSLLTVG